jgi:WD40 repeat protein
MAFSGDGKILVTADNDNIVRIFDVASGRRLGDLVPVVNPANVLVRPDGKQVAVIMPAGTQVWDLDPDHLRTEACRRAGRNLTTQEWDRYFPDEPHHPTCAQWASG